MGSVIIFIAFQIIKKNSVALSLQANYTILSSNRIQTYCAEYVLHSMFEFHSDSQSSLLFITVIVYTF
jgi:hypothetical protein